MNRRKSLERLLSIRIQNNDSDDGNDNDNAEILQKLKEYGINSTYDLFEYSPYAIMSICNINYEKALKLIKTISIAVAYSKFIGSAYELLNNKDRFLPTGCINLDKKLRGGFPVGSIIEICGPPGIGKTQLCLGTCADLILKVPSKISIVYYDTELKFDINRLLEIIRNRSNTAVPFYNIQEMMKNVVVKRPGSCNELLKDIENLHSLLIDEGVSLIIIDSIASLPRKENLNESDKEVYLLRQAGILKKLAELCRCTVLVTNQIVNDNNNFDSINDVIYNNTLAKYKPALGSMWYHCVNTRLTLTARKVDSSDIFQIDLSQTNTMTTLSQNVSSSHQGYQKYLRMTKSPLIANFEVAFKITPLGISIGEN